MANILLVGAVDSALNYNQTINYDEISANVELGIRTELTSVENTDIAIIGFHVMFRQKNTPILSYSIRLSFKVEGWSSIISSMDEQQLRTLNEVGELLEISAGFLRGSMYVRALNTPVSKFSLPILSVTDLQKNLVFNKSSK